MGTGRRVVRVFKWFAPIVAVLLAVAWYFSNEHVFVLSGPLGTQAAMTGGQLMLSIDTPPVPAAERPKTGIHDYFNNYRWWMNGGWRSANKWIAMPMWLVIAAIAGLGGFAWRAERRARRAHMRGACPSCGYDRTGLKPGAPCPECAAPAGSR
ncbi:MAG: hypothetical protein K2X32_01515 [Phycisphaerales bacterium]|nr:hypothetical protein [Phycisphaerales bacterium]